MSLLGTFDQLNASFIMSYRKLHKNIFQDSLNRKLKRAAFI